MTKSLTQINRQIEKLQRQADALKRQEMKGVIGRIRTAIDHYGLTAQDLGLSGKSTVSAKAAAAPARAAKRSPARKAVAVKKPGPIKYRDEAGNSWTGRGKRPNWFKAAIESGTSLEDLAA